MEEVLGVGVGIESEYQDSYVSYKLHITMFDEFITKCSQVSPLHEQPSCHVVTLTWLKTSSYYQSYLPRGRRSKKKPIGREKTGARNSNTTKASNS